MKLELELPEQVIKKIKAWSLLSEYEGGPDEALVQIIDHALSQEIKRCLDIGDGVPVYPRQAPQVPEPARFVQAKEAPEHSEEPIVGRPDNLMERDSSLELGDADLDEDGGSEDEEAFVPSQGGLNEDDLDRDMLLEDPEHEALSSDGPYEVNPGESAEDMFSSQLNLPKVPQVDPGVRRREQLKRNTRNTRRAKVTNYMGGE